MKKRILCAIMCVLFVVLPITSFAEYQVETTVPSAVLMEASTGKILYEKDADVPLPPASVTKVMTLLIVMEAIEAGKLTWKENVTVSDKAASMGGSQIFLEPGEQMTVDEMVKSVTVASANDAAVALAEHIYGSEEAFVARMNERASELGMVNTHFQNTNGLDDTVTDHYTSARDIAIMSRELIAHEKILEYSSIWMDTVRNGEFGLTNTNRLIRFYEGANGLKTGSTSKAKFCISATAKRNGMQLICVIMAADTRDVRNEAAKQLLDFGFANYSVAYYEGKAMDDISIVGGKRYTCKTRCDEFSALTEKGKNESIERNVVLPDNINAPVEKGDIIGNIEYKLDGEVIGNSNIYADETVNRITYFGILNKLIKKFLTV